MKLNEAITALEEDNIKSLDLSGKVINNGALVI